MRTSRVDRRLSPGPARLAAALALALGGGAAAQVVDGSFESTGPAGPAAGAWQQTSTLAGSPLCDASCLLPGQVSAARSGEWWAWFGGNVATSDAASLMQTVVLPAGTATLRFYFQGFSQRTDAVDSFRVIVDGQTLLTITSADVRVGGPLAGSVWLERTLVLPGTLGGARQIRFESSTLGGTASAPRLTNFFVDDVSVSVQTACYANCDGSTTVPALNALDFSCFLNRYQSAQSLPPASQVGEYANCDGSTTVPALNALDFSCYLNRYQQGCP